MSFSAPFISVQDLSASLGRDVTTDDGAVTAIDVACDICRQVAGQNFNQVLADTILLDGTGSDTIILPQYPVTNVAGTILVNGCDETAFTFTSTGLLFRGSAGSGFSNGGYGWTNGTRPVWPRGRQNIQVTYDHGYSDFPPALRGVALQIATRMVVQGAAMAENVGAVSVRYAVSSGDLDKNELRILQNYRQVRS